MRVLIVPEVYRSDDLSANGTVNDAVTWVREWLEIDESLHVYWLLPQQERANYGPEDVLADRERVTLIEATSVADGLEREGIEHSGMFTENGYSPAQLRAIEREIFERGGYVDVIVDQLRTGRFTLYKWLCAHTDHWAARVRPFDVVANVHDLQIPRKYRWCSYRNAFQMQMEICAVAFADGVWFSAGVDADRMGEHAAAFLRDGIIEETLANAVETLSPIEFDRYEESYAEEPEWLHVAGSLWDKKCIDHVLSVAEALHERFDVRTIVTSVEGIPDEYRSLPWVEAHPHASRETYEAALQQGDLAICASEYETMARTPFEQAASGQVLLLRDEPWIRDSVPDDYRLTADLDSLENLAVWTLDHWTEAVAESQRMVEHARQVRSPERCGRRTYRDLRRRVAGKVERYESVDLGPVQAVLESVDGPVTLDELHERVERDRDADGIERSEWTHTDLRFALRTLGYRDAANPGTPVFEPPPS